MGLLDKVKGILFDEEEIEIPEIKKETRKEIKKEFIEEEENPIREIKVPKDDFSDREYKSETTFTFPIDFEDEEPEPIKVEEKPKPRLEEYKQPVRNEKRDYSDFLNKRDNKKQFKPTPIISPVYGVLDQNYKKEDVIIKKDILRSPKELTLEEVRKRAFGSLEDELEQNLTTDTKEIKIKEELKIKKETKIETKVEEPVDKLKTIGELIEEDDSRLDIPEIDGIFESDVEYNNDSATDIEEPKNSIEDLLSHNEEPVEEVVIEEEKVLEETEDDNDIDDEEADLFSLIDSMYEEKGE